MRLDCHAMLGTLLHKFWHAPAAVLRRGLGLRLLLATLVVACMTLMASLQLGINVWMGRDRFAQEAQRAAAAASELLEERTRRMLQPTGTMVRQIGFDPLATSSTLIARLQRAYVLTAEIEANPLLAAVYIGYDNGDFVLARPLRDPEERARFEAPDAAVYLLQTMEAQTDGRRIGRYHYLDGDNRALGQRELPEYRYDPRQRDWFGLARRTKGLAVGDPYLFFTTKSPGLTLSQRSHEGRSVVGADLLLKDLARTLSSQRLTPGTQLALVNEGGRVLAYSEPQRLVRQDGDKLTLASLSELGHSALPRLLEHEADRAHTLSTEDQGDWVGIRAPFEVGLGPHLQLLAVTPMEELIAPARARANRARWIAAGLALALLPIGWWAGSAIARRLDQLSRRTQRLIRFDFRSSPIPRSAVHEVNQLHLAIEHMGGTIESFLRLSQQMASEPEMERMLDQVLAELVQATHCEGAEVALWDPAQELMQRAAHAGQVRAPLPERFRYPADRPPRREPREPFEGLHQMDLELHGRDARLQGLLVLEYPADVSHEDPAFVAFARQLSGMLAVAIETRQLIAAQRQLFDAVIRLMAEAIDAKSPYTGGHCDRVPRIATQLLDRLCAETDGRYAAFKLSDTERYAFHLGAWLHDCGKVTSPEHIVDKATKLELIHNRIHEVRTRFELLHRDAQIAHLRGEIEDAALAERLAQLQQDFAFIAECNVGGEFMADAAIERLRALGAQTWQRHFDDRLGLSAEEARRLKEARPDTPDLPAAEPLLADRPEHRVPWGERRPPVARDDPRNRFGFDMTLPAHQQNQGELHNLGVRRGTLTDEDRFKINDHIVQTLIMLKSLPWPQGLEQVPDLAATHHEKLDGRGYPRGLGDAQLSLQDRVMALADVFEALTAADRPYKAPKTLTETLKIMAFMCKDRHLDTELFRYFLHSRLWDDFAAEFMQADQRDAVDIAALEALLPPT